jgi:hypothetical protein
MGGLQTSGVLGTERGEGCLGAGKRELVGINRVLLRLANAIVGAVDQRLKPRLSSRQSAFGGLDALSPTVHAHVLESELLLSKPGLRGGDVF